MTTTAPKPYRVRDISGVPFTLLGVLWELLGMGINAPTVSTLAIESGYSVGSVRNGLKTLSYYGLAVSPGTLGQGGELVWMLAESCPRLFNASQKTSSVGEPAQPNALQKTSSVDNNSITIANASQKKASVPESESVNILLNDSLPEGWPKNETELRAAYLKVLAAGPVFANISEPLANTMAAEGGAFLPHLLAHLARIKSKSHALDGYERPGVYLKDQAKVRAEVPESELPPAGLSFADAFQWAMNGGKTDKQIADAKRESELALAAQEIADREAERLAELEQAEAVIAKNTHKESAHPSVSAPLPGTNYTPAMAWHAALGQLQIETTRQVFDTWLRGAEVVECAEGVFTVAVQNKYQVDWLTNRLLGSVKRTLSGLVGASVDVRFVTRALGTARDQVTP